MTRNGTIRPARLDRLPPHAADAEAAVIGCCLLAPLDCVPAVQEVVTTKDFFYDARCQVAWQAIQSQVPEETDVVSVRQWLKDRDVADVDALALFLDKCLDSVPSAANLPYYLDQVREKFVLRRIIAVCTEAIQDAYGSADAAEDVLDRCERRVLAIQPQGRDGAGIRELVQAAIERIETRIRLGGALTGLPTGLPDLDRLTDGLHPGEMVVLAGFPSTGKTALAVNIAVHNALQSVPAAVFSAEMRPVQLVVRSICSEARVNFHKVCEKHLGLMGKAAASLASAPLHIEQASRLSIGQVCAAARRLRQRHGVRLVVVDYIQLLTGVGDNREQEISSVSKGLKAMALELDIPVVALSQLTDDGKLRESRAIGQDADTVWKVENEGEWQPSIQPVRLRVEKCRDGATGQVPLTFLKEYTRIVSAAKADGGEEPAER